MALIIGIGVLLIKIVAPLFTNIPIKKGISTVFSWAGWLVKILFVVVIVTILCLSIVYYSFKTEKVVRDPNASEFYHTMVWQDRNLQTVGDDNYCIVLERSSVAFKWAYTEDVAENLLIKGKNVPIGRYYVVFVSTVKKGDIGKVSLKNLETGVECEYGSFRITNYTLGHEPIVMQYWRDDTHLSPETITLRERSLKVAAMPIPELLRLRE